MTDLKGKTALVTGSTSGIGRATALALAARVLVVGRNEQRAKDVAAEIEGGGGSATFRLTTLSGLESAQDLVEWATEAGGGHVDILINNAGVAVLGPSSAATEAEFDATFALNVKVPFFLVASLAPAMAERGWGSIVNVSTMVASFGQAGMAMYGASRAALELLTKAWAAEYGARGVRVNAVAPGPTRTALMEAVPEEMVNQARGAGTSRPRGPARGTRRGDRLPRQRRRQLRPRRHPRGRRRRPGRDMTPVTPRRRSPERPGRPAAG
jgi:NAD(P)-dependent dehydrogenase (short-subunit alcohol dehydrogenase family)